MKPVGTGTERTEPILPSEMRKILFVDDEPMILRGLERALRRHRDAWDMTFALGGELALEKLNETNFDVVVSDMRMPGVDGATVLRCVRQNHPEVVRIMISGFANIDETLRTVHVAHQFLEKPCTPSKLENTLDRAFSLHSIVSSDNVRRVVGDLGKLPSVPKVFQELTRVLEDEEASVQEVSEVLQRDMGMCAKLLQLVNSSFFRMARRTTNIEDAIVHLGFNTVKSLVLCVEVFGGTNGVPNGISIENLQRHSLLTGSLASKLVKGKQNQDDAFTAGLLHDVGKLLLATQLPQQFGQAQKLAREQDLPLHEAEKQVLGASHAEIGAYLLALWGLPYTIVEAVANHHLPQQVPQVGFDVLSAIYVADSLSSELLADAEAETNDERQLDLQYIEQMGMSKQLERWRSLAQRQAEKMGLAPEPTLH